MLCKLERNNGKQANVFFIMELKDFSEDELQTNYNERGARVNIKYELLWENVTGVEIQGMSHVSWGNNVKQRGNEWIVISEWPDVAR